MQEWSKERETVHEYTQVPCVVHFTGVIMRYNACTHSENLVEDVVEDNLTQWHFGRIGNTLLKACLLLREALMQLP